jgi:VanZ family protein
VQISRFEANHPVTMSIGPRNPLLERLSVAALSLYWLALFVGTHLPRLQPTFAIRHSDKWLHATAFFALAMLLAWCWSLRGAFGPRQAAAALAGIAAYGAFDELTQPLVNRHASAADWMADLVGAAAGLAVFLVAQAAFRRA